MCRSAEAGGDRVPGRVRARVPVQQHHRRPVTAVPHPQAHLAHVDRSSVNPSNTAASYPSRLLASRLMARAWGSDAVRKAPTGIEPVYTALQAAA